MQSFILIYVRLSFQQRQIKKSILAVLKLSNKQFHYNPTIINLQSYNPQIFNPLAKPSLHENPTILKSLNPQILQPFGEAVPSGQP